MATQDTLTPLASSTNSAPFVMEEGRKTKDVVSGGGGGGGFVVLHKLRSKTILQSVPEGRSVRADSNQSTQSSQAAAAAPGEWNARFAGCTSGGDVALVVCCPCFPAAKLHSLLGGSLESGMIFFGGLVFTMLLLVGLSNSNMSSAPTGDSGAPRTYSPATSGDDKFVAEDADPTTHTPSAATTTSAGLANAQLYRDLAIALLVLFLLGIAYLRTKTRHRFNIPGTRALDCLLSFACCWCVLSQARAHVEKHNRFELGLDTPSDTPTSTLPAYT